ncbi:hypothetical protein FAZ19_23470 [Sphingobacterium alkalisoli]|uniref:Uncharacterized protein n=1 Tax=Sphingobacterium alkalisoli TaxID=1874115 RepID=A0A4U0GN05_9SPHI|nr:hypothetical protein [Sphingobacterium alkalisoli]TJY59704.1 hypothetical protein FAZ19_23470 [Sphingobacterium alkalisoli]GGH32938.1 hypothetical protein GCM10011418_46790 [Sphingobacterium alkalisoli]
MKIEGMQQVLLLLYSRAKQKFEECINDEGNKFLKDEVSVSLYEIVIIEKDIKIVFSQRDFEQYLFEISLVLFDGQKEIGKYLYIENEKEEAIDDSLVFY